ncbi:hypothetical protein [Pseudomonas avellanae]|nr:hypothetical protein [Pseudomonas avellanae]
MSAPGPREFWTELGDHHEAVTFSDSVGGDCLAAMVFNFLNLRELNHFAFSQTFNRPLDVIVSKANQVRDLSR